MVDTIRLVTATRCNFSSILIFPFFSKMCQWQMYYSPQAGACKEPRLLPQKTHIRAGTAADNDVTQTFTMSSVSAGGPWARSLPAPSFSFPIYKMENPSLSPRPWRTEPAEVTSRHWGPSTWAGLTDCPDLPTCKCEGRTRAE